MIAIGAKVRLLNAVGEGTVSGHDRQGNALVLMEDGFEIPFLEKELVVISSPAVEQMSNIRNIGQASSLQSIVYMAFAVERVEKDSSIVALRILNRLSEKINFTIYSETNQVFTLEKNVEVGSAAAVMILSEPLTSLLKKDRFFVQITLLPKDTRIIPATWSGFVKHQVPALVDPSAWPQQADLAQRALLIEVYPPKKVEPQHFPGKDKLQVIRNSEKENWLLTDNSDGLYEVDLHIEELLEDTLGMSNGEIITYQLRHFEKCMDEARQRRIKKFVVIHGIGKGKLKSEIQFLLKQEKIEHFDASYQRYGYGATEVRLR